jgi:hypothetical protein
MRKWIKRYLTYRMTAQGMRLLRRRLGLGALLPAIAYMGYRMLRQRNV